MVGGIAAVVSILKAWKGDVIRDAIRGTTTGSQISVDAGVEASGTSVMRTVILAGFAAGLIAPLLVVGSIVSERLGTVMVFILLGLGLNIVVGYAGLLDLGYVAFFAVGAYATGILTGGMLNSFEGITRPRSTSTSTSTSRFRSSWPSPRSSAS